MISWQARVVDLKEQNLTWDNIAKTINEEYDLSKTGSSVRAWYRRSNRVPSTPIDVMQDHGLDADKWQVKTYRSDKGDSRLSVKPIQNAITFADIDEYFASKTFELPHFEPTQYDPSGEILEICLPDLHSGLFSWHMETGEDYDVHIAVKRFNHCLADILERCRGRKFKKIYFVTLGDILHVDNDRQETTHGTFQQSDGRIPKIVRMTMTMLIDCLMALESIAPVEVIYLVGNHDAVCGYMLLTALEMAFRSDKNITFDVDPNPHKSRLIGVTLVGWTHGEMPKRNQARWLMSEAREAFGKSRFAEVHQGHDHTERKRELPFIDNGDEGIIIRNLPNIASASYWEHQQGYPKNPKTVISFVWHEEIGLREIWHSNL